MKDKPKVPSPDEVWKLVRETQKNLKDVAANQKKLQASQEAYQKIAEKERRELRIGQKELQASQRKTDLQIQKVDGRFNKRWGHLVESLVKGKLVPLLRERGIKVNQVLVNVEARLSNGDDNSPKTEFDIIAANGKEIVIVEVKTVLTPRDIYRFLPNVRKFKAYFPRYQNDIIYGAMAYLKSENRAHVISEEEGLFVIEAVGDSASLINKPNFKPKVFA